MTGENDAIKVPCSLFWLESSEGYAFRSAFTDATTFDADLRTR